MALLGALLLSACQESGIVSFEKQVNATHSTRSVDDDGKSRPFGPYASLPDPSGAGPAQAAKVFSGGEFTGNPDQSRMPSALPRASGGQTYTLNLVDASVTEGAKAVLGDIFKTSFTVDPKIEGRITIQTTRPVDSAGIAELFEASLRTVGAAIVQNGNIYRVVTADQAAMGARLGGSDGGGQQIGNSVKVVPMRYIAATEMKRILEPIVSFGGVVRVDTSRNALLISGTAQEMSSIEEAISVFDVNAMKGMSFALVPVRGGEPDAIVDGVNRIFSSNAEGAMSGMVQLVPNAKLKSILIMARQPQYLREAQQWVRRLDDQAAGPQREIHSYVLRNRQAKELVEVLNSIFANEVTGGGDAGRRGGQRVRSSEPDAAAVPGQLAQATGFSGGGAGGDRFSGAFGGGAARRSFDMFSGLPIGGATLATGGQENGAAAETASTGFGAGGPGGEPRIKVVADPAQNALLILASQEDFKRVARVIANLDIVPNQVLIEATIAEVTLNDDLKFGVRWFLQNQRGNQTGTFTNAIDGAISAAFPGFSYVFRAAQANVTINALAQVGRVNVLASPSLMVVDKKTATLQIGDQVPITTQSAVSVLTPGAPVVNSVSYKDTGVILNITPRINESGRVLLDIEQEVSTVQRTTTSGIDSPTFGRRRVRTTVVVNDGEGITLGGLIQDRTSRVATQVPVLGDIPLFGNAFKDKQDLVEKTELVIMLTPRVVRDLNEAKAVTDEYRRKVEAFAPTRNPGRVVIQNAKRVLR
ncbi:type II secretion system secretin GspD [Bosea sp. 2RAB26]|uniref:type II secretion system secretin GspD n=1 Tax=Bosea sp. 2RAB26 TaxID=3237476 RepID=UPI003F91F02C